MAINKKCICATKSDKDWCTSCSRIKAVIMLKNGNNHLKLRNTITGKLNCPVWYSRYSKNGKSDQWISSKMIEKIEQSKYRGLYNKIEFYDNLTHTKLSI